MQGTVAITAASGDNQYHRKIPDGGTINDIAIHAVNPVRFITGYGLKNVTGLGEFVKEINGETELLIDTAEVIRTSREVLTIQAAAKVIPFHKEKTGVIDQMTPVFQKREI